jgi:hypothetical protein
VNIDLTIQQIRTVRTLAARERTRLATTKLKKNEQPSSRAMEMASVHQLFTTADQIVRERDAIEETNRKYPA